MVLGSLGRIAANHRAAASRTAASLRFCSSASARLIKLAA
jgi:hypothetical protein